MGTIYCNLQILTNSLCLSPGGFYHFPDGGTPTPKGRGTPIYYLAVFLKNCMKMTTLGRDGCGVGSSASPKSANTNASMTCFFLTFHILPMKQSGVAWAKRGGLLLEVLALFLTFSYTLWKTSGISNCFWGITKFRPHPQFWLFDEIHQMSALDQFLPELHKFVWIISIFVRIRSVFIRNDQSYYF